MRFRFVGLSLLFLLLTSFNYKLPLKREVSLSGSYGELRSNHFHSGVDFRVGGVIGEPIYAAGDGYIDMISISPTGYGNALFIKHPNGEITLYGHLHNFENNIAKWVRERQYESESFSQRLYPDSTLFKVKAGDFIGNAGNSGSSGGPHLHFELRDGEGRGTLNPLARREWPLKDEIAPQLRRVEFHGFTSKGGLPYSWRVATRRSGGGATLSLPDTFYVAVDAIDRQNGTNARLAVSQYNYYLDGELRFSFTPMGVPFNKGRYINSIVEYSSKALNNLSLVKSRVEEGGGIWQNSEAKEKGLFILEDDKVHKVKVELLDEHGNRASHTFSVKRAGGGVKESTLIPRRGDIEKSKVAPWYLTTHLVTPMIELTLPAGSLYSTHLIYADTATVKGNFYYSIFDERIATHNSYTLSLEPHPSFDKLDREKLLLVHHGARGKRNYLASYRDGRVEAKVSSFGRFTLSEDTTPPRVVPNFNNGAKLSGRSALVFTITDRESGISTYRVTIDGKWVLSSYDPKRGRLESELRKDVIERGKNHKVEVVVVDRVGNRRAIERTFFW